MSLRSRVLLVVHQFVPDGLGGSEVYCLSLAHGLVERGYAVEILTYAPSGDPGIRVSRTHYDGIPLRTLRFALKALADPVRAEYDNQEVGKYLLRQPAADRPDLVHVCHPGNLSTAVLAAAHETHVPAVVTLTDHWAICPAGMLLRQDGTLCSGPTELGACLRCLTAMGPRGRPYRAAAQAVPLWAVRAAVQLDLGALNRRCRPLAWLASLRDRAPFIRDQLLQARALVCPSRFLKDTLAANGYPPERLLFMPHGVDYPGHPKPPRRLDEAQPLRFGFVGPLAPHKGAHIAIDAFTRLPAGVDAHLAIWGPLPRDADGADGHTRRLLRAIARSDRIAHLGGFARSEVSRVYEQIDALIVPSLLYENSPTVIYEALASRTPVIASDLGGMRELVTDYGGGWLFPRGEARALAGLVSRLASAPDMLRSAAEGMRAAPTFAQHVDALCGIYRDLLPAPAVGASRG